MGRLGLSQILSWGVNYWNVGLNRFSDLQQVKQILKAFKYSLNIISRFLGFSNITVLKSKVKMQLSNK